jgi:predicted transcriptional regulator
MKLFTTLLEEDLHKKLKELSVKLNKKITKLVEEAITDLIKKHEGNSK